MIANYSITYPSIKTKLISHSENRHSLQIQPLLPGFGYTLGNSMRRILLSTVPGFAVTRIRINDLTHEYQPIQGVVEDAMDVVMNLKLLRGRILTDDDSVILNIHKSSEGEVTASDFEKNSKAVIANEGLYICYLGKGATLDIEIELTRGHGYLSVEEINFSGITNPQDIYVDAVFSPVTNVAFNVEKVRVGDKTDFDKIIIDFETDGTVEPEEVARYTVNLLSDLIGNIKSSFETSLDIQKYNPTLQTKEEDVISPVGVSPSASGDEIDLPVRIKNILEKNGIFTNAELKSRSSELNTMPGVGASTIQLIKDYIKTIS